MSEEMHQTLPPRQEKVRDPYNMVDLYRTEMDFPTVSSWSLPSTARCTSEGPPRRIDNEIKVAG